MERTTQTETILPKWKQFVYCLIGDDKFRRERQRVAATATTCMKKNLLNYFNRKFCKKIYFQM